MPTQVYNIAGNTEEFSLTGKSGIAFDVVGASDSDRGTRAVGFIPGIHTRGYTKLTIRVGSIGEPTLIDLGSESAQSLTVNSPGGGPLYVDTKNWVSSSTAEYGEVDASAIVTLTWQYSTQQLLMEAVRTAILASPLANRGYTSNNVRIRRKPSIEGIGTGRKCVISPMPERISGDEANNEQDDIGYGVLISLAQPGNSNPEYGPEFDDLVVDREELRQFFINTPERIAPSLPTGSYYLGLKVEPGPMLIAEAAQNNIDATALVLRATVRETHS